MKFIQRTFNKLITRILFQRDRQSWLIVFLSYIVQTYKQSLQRWSLVLTPLILSVHCTILQHCCVRLKQTEGVWHCEIVYTHERKELNILLCNHCWWRAKYLWREQDNEAKHTLGTKQEINPFTTGVSSERIVQINSRR